ncbi:DUF2812 domain-containing protein [Alkalicoccobacillus gibsonii]|uniref:DUF2812 domain-containing protein n=1 Tax=Alkalicoccobacillus gibsonii TaxID=79881 RepID=UPI003F7CC998
MKMTKYMMSQGLAFGEETDMKKLQHQSNEGWHLEKFAFMGYTLKKGEPAEYIYNIDYRKVDHDEQDEYMNLFSESGWSHVTSNHGMHIFRAQPGTRPIFSDEGTIAEKHHNLGKPMLPIALSIMFISLLVSVGSFLSTGILQKGLTVATVILLVLFIPLTWTLVTIYKNKWIAEQRKGLVRFTKTLPYLILILCGALLFGLSETVHQSFRLVAYMMVGAAIGMGLVSLLQTFTMKNVNKAN